MAPVLSGIHHLKFPVSDLDTGIAWFERAFGAVRVGRQDHRDGDGALFGVILMLPGLDVPLELRLAPAAAAATNGYDPVTFGVADEAALDAWITHLDSAGIAHSPKIAGFIGHLIEVGTPDGLAVRLYTDPVGGFENADLTGGQVAGGDPWISSPLMASRAAPDDRA